MRGSDLGGAFAGEFLAIVIIAILIGAGLVLGTQFTIGWLSAHVSIY